MMRYNAAHHRPRGGRTKSIDRSALLSPMANTGHTGRGSIWYNWPGLGCGANHQITPTTFLNCSPYDIAIIGAGVVGCALGYELSQYRLRVVMIDRAFDVGEGASKGNSAIIHTGFDATPGSLESELVTKASRAWPELAQKLRVPFRTVSALMLALDEEQAANLPKIRADAASNGVDDVYSVSAAEARQLEPHISPAVRGGLVIPRESIIDPFTICVAYSEIARENGVDLAFGLSVSGVEDADEQVKVIVADGGIRIPARWIINAAGLGARRLVDAYGGAPMDLNPRRGQFLVYDRDCSSLVSRILLPIPTKHTKGMLVAPTIFGNLLAGPTAEDLPADATNASSTTHEGLAAVRASAEALCPALVGRSVIANYAGVRSNCTQGSYWMRFNDGHPNIVTLAGIRSTGLTSSITTAQHVIRRMQDECGLELVKHPAAVDSRSESRWPGWFDRPFENPARMRANIDYGRIVCSCENISRGEIQDALNGCPGIATLDGLKRRTRVLTGRCQGFNCCVPVAEIISAHYGVPLGAVTKRGPSTEFIARHPDKARVCHLAKGTMQPALREHYAVVIIGGGPAGIGTAAGLGKMGIAPVLLVDRANRVGGIPAFYEKTEKGVPTFVVWTRGRVLVGKQFVEMLQRRLNGTCTTVSLESQVVDVNRQTGSLRMVRPGQSVSEIRAEAIVFACGAREMSSAERGWIAGDRPTRQFFTMQLLQLIDGNNVLPTEHAAIIGSDVVSYSAAAKLCAVSARVSQMVDRTPHPQARFWERLYFRQWYRPGDYVAATRATIVGAASTTAVEVDDRQYRCDGIVFSGNLIPNSELIEAAGLPLSRPGRIPLAQSNGALAEPGWFIAGAELGGFHGADWCYRDGVRVGRHVGEYLGRKKTGK